jgi:hypothetical protein
LLKLAQSKNLTCRSDGTNQRNDLIHNSNEDGDGEGNDEDDDSDSNDEDGNGDEDEDNDEDESNGKDNTDGPCAHDANSASPASFPTSLDVAPLDPKTTANSAPNQPSSASATYPSLGLSMYRRARMLANHPREIGRGSCAKR